MKAIAASATKPQMSLSATDATRFEESTARLCGCPSICSVQTTFSAAWPVPPWNMSRMIGTATAEQQTATMTPAHGPIAMSVMAVPIMSKKRGSRKAATM